jgi:hypothetical protein
MGMWSWKRQASGLSALTLMPRRRVTMARPKQSEPILGLDRRQLLASAAVITAAGIVPKAEVAQAANPGEVANAAELTTSDVPTWNVCAGTARKIKEIAARNIIRAEAGLPLLSVPQELRRMKQVTDAMAFEDFADRRRQAFWNEVLGGARNQRRAELVSEPFPGRSAISIAVSAEFFGNGSR